MRNRIFLCILFLTGILLLSYSIQFGYAYPPAVGLTGKAPSCLSCHADNGPWKDDENNIVDIVDKETGKSLRQPDGSFLIEATRGEKKTVVTVIGRKKDDKALRPYRNAWIYVDPARIKTNSLTVFAESWDVNLSISCRLVGDKMEGFEEDKITALPMTVIPLKDAKDATLQLQVMITAGESVKGKPKEGMQGNYFERKVILKVKEGQ